VELYELYISSNIIRVIKSRRIKWAGQVVRMGDRRYRKAAYRILLKKLEGKNHFGNLVLDGRLILNCTLKKWDR